MNKITPVFRDYCVKLQIYIWRQGWVGFVILFLLALAMCLCFFWNPQQKAAIVANSNVLKIEKDKYQKLIATPTTQVQINVDAENLQRLNNRVYAQSEVSNLLQVIVQIAKSKNIALTQSEIQTTKEGYAGLQQFQVTFPVRTGYIEMRSFIQEVLRQLDGASVDQISIKRENVAQGQLEVRIKLSLWVDVSKKTSRAISKP